MGSEFTLSVVCLRLKLLGSISWKDGGGPASSGGRWGKHSSEWRGLRGLPAAQALPGVLL